MYKKYIKRLLDFLLAAAGLPVLLIIVILLAPVIKISDRGPVFYKSKRIGRYGRIFTMYKFRSMKIDAPDIRLPDGSTYNDEQDQRVTKIGRIIRKTSIDETPQLINVIKGDMSLVGPRPDPTDWLNRYPEDIRVFLNVRPGITGYNQAYFRNSANGEEKMKNDAFYAKHCSFWLDVKIMVKTIANVLGQKNIYNI